MKNLPAQFITLEGTEGVGKSTNLAFIHQWLEQHHIEVVITREPGGTEVAEAIRDILLTHWQETLQAKTELLLIMAARIQHIHQVIMPALQAGQWVLCDRYIDATYAYQGGGRTIAHEDIDLLVKHFLPSLHPHLTLLLDAPVAIGAKRLPARGKQDRFETEKLSFFEQVRAIYLERAAAMPERIHIIDASLPLLDVQQAIAVVLTSHIAQ